MSVLQALVNAYDRMADRKEVPPFGYSSEKIGFVIVLDEQGATVGKPIDIRGGEGKKRVGRPVYVPAAFKRPGTTPRSFFLWDKTAYALAVTASADKDASARFAAFVSRHRDALAGTDDPGLLALLRFVESWRPEQFAEREWPDEMKDENVVFAFGRDYLRDEYIHDRLAARALWSRLCADNGSKPALCLVSGTRGPIARLHPSIKGVWGAQTAGASIVSFNLEAFTSYGHEQGENAPVSEAAASAYAAVLNKFFERESKHRIQIGDTSSVFWADASDADTATAAEDIFFASLAGVDEASQAKNIAAALEDLKQGRLTKARPQLASGVRFHVLGLAPNAARLSVRFWFEDDFGIVARNLQRHVAAMRIEPPPKDALPPLWLCLVETASQRKSENVPPNLAGEWLRAILAGTPYPRSLQSTLLMRLRADKNVGALRVAILKACLVTRGQEVPVALDPTCKNKGYLLGRLFAAYEHIQTTALGNVNATIRDKFYGSASATPRKVFPLVDKGAVNHLSKIGKENRGRAVNLEKVVSEIVGGFDPAADPYPNALAADEQALFAVGYYHQKNEFFRRKDAPASIVSGIEGEAA